MDHYQSNRRWVFSPYVRPDSHGIEIGPAYRPTFPKSEGYSVTVVDCCATDALIAKHDADANIPKELVRQIEAVDVVWSGESLQHLPVSLRGADYVAACHVIEHARDLCGFLKDCSVLLKEGGFLLLAMPDRRCVLDCYRPASTLGDVLLAHLLPQAYDLKSHLDEAWYGALLSNAGAWPMEHLRHEIRNGEHPALSIPSAVAAGCGLTTWLPRRTTLTDLIGTRIDGFLTPRASHRSSSFWQQTPERISSRKRCPLVSNVNSMRYCARASAPVRALRPRSKVSGLLCCRHGWRT